MLNDDAVSYPVTLSNIERGAYYVQAVWDNNSGGRQISLTPGNIYNHTIKVNLTLNRDQVFSISCKEVIPEPVFEETEFCKEFKIQSKSLTAFHGKNISLNAAVLLPKEYYKQPNRKFPVLYCILG